MILPLFSADGLLSRLTSIFFGFAPTFLLLSIGYVSFICYCLRSFLDVQNVGEKSFNLFAENLCRYEAIFYGALVLVLMAWILLENTLLYVSKVKRSTASLQNVENNVILELGDRYLQLSDVRIPLTFVSVTFFSSLKVNFDFSITITTETRVISF